MKNWKYISLVILTTLGVTVAGCASGTQSPSPAQDQTQSQQGGSGQQSTEMSEHDKLVEQAKKEGKLVVYGGTPEPQLVQYLEKFHEKYPFIDVSEYFRAGGSKLFSKVMTEIESGQLNADLLASANLGDLIELKKKNLLLEYHSPEGKAIFDNMKDPGYWYAYRINTIPMSYNPDILPEAEAPKTWADLLDPKYKGKIAFEDAGSGSQYAQWYALREVLGDEFFEKLSKQEPKIYNSSGLIAQGLQTGEILVAGSSESFRYYQEAVLKGVPLKLVNPPEGIAGMIAPIGIMKDAKHPAAAKLYVEFALSQEGQKFRNSEVLGAYSSRADVPPPEGMEAYSEINVLIPKDFDDLQKKREVFTETWTRLFQSKQK